MFFYIYFVLRPSKYNVIVYMFIQLPLNSVFAATVIGQSDENRQLLLINLNFSHDGKE